MTTLSTGYGTEGSGILSEFVAGKANHQPEAASADDGVDKQQPGRTGQKRTPEGMLHTIFGGDMASTWVMKPKVHAEDTDSLVNKSVTL